MHLENCIGENLITVWPARAVEKYQSGTNARTLSSSVLD